MPAFIYQHLFIKQILSYYNKEYKYKLNIWESIKNLTRTYVCDTILGRKVNLFKNDDMAEFVFECSMFVIMNRYNDSYILPEKIYYSIIVKDYAQFLADVGAAISLLSNNVIFRLRNYFEELKRKGAIFMTGRVIRLNQLLDKLEKEQITEEERKELIMLADNMTEEEYLGEMPSEEEVLGFPTEAEIISEEGQYAKILMEYIYENDIEMYTMLMGLNKMKGFVHQRVDEFLTEMFKLEDLYTNEHKTENMPFPKYLSLCYQASSYAREKAMPILLQIPSSIAGI